MTRRQRDPLRPLTDEERTVLEQISRAHSEPASHVARAKALLAVSAGQSYRAAAQTAGQSSGDTVSQWVARFNHDGLTALEPRHGGGPARRYGVAEQERILVEARRTPDRAQDGTATWSLTMLQRALRQAADGLPQVSTYTIWLTLRQANRSWQRARTWCDTGKVKRKRKAGVVEVIDPDAIAKKTCSRKPIGTAKSWVCRCGAAIKRALFKRYPIWDPVGNRSVSQSASRMSISATGPPNC